ncbi:MAG: alpha/beta fold hydrolase [bacterium]
MSAVGPLWLERMVSGIARAASRKEPRPDRLWWAEDLPLRTVRVDGHDICFVSAGQGRPVVLVHGFATSLSIWSNQIRPLSEHFHVLALDLLGHGYSDKPDVGYGIDCFASCVAGFLNAIGVESADLVGSSMGGLLSLCVALTHPDRVHRLVLIGSSSPAYMPDRLKAARRFARRRPRLWKTICILSELLTLVPSRGIERRGKDRMFFDPEVVAPQWIEHAYELRRMEGFSRMLARTLESLSSEEEGEWPLERIRQPTCLIWGEADAVIPVEHGRLLERRLEHATLNVIPACGHLPMLEKPEVTTRCLLDFLLAPGAAAARDAAAR